MNTEEKIQNLSELGAKLVARFNSLNEERADIRKQLKAIEVLLTSLNKDAQEAKVAEWEAGVKADPPEQIFPPLEP